MKNRSLLFFAVLISFFQLAFVPSGNAAADLNQLSETMDFAWVTSSEMPQAVAETAVVAVKDSLYVMGGKTNGVATNAAWVFHVQSKSWKPLAPMGAKRFGHGAAVLGNRIYVFGGIGSEGPTDFLQSVESFDSELGIWKKESSLLVARSHFGIAEFNQKIYLVGGESADSSALGLVEVFDPVTQQYTRKRDLDLGRKGPGLVNLNGTLYVIGGETPEGLFLKTTAQYSLAEDKWVPSVPLKVGRRGFSVASYGNFGFIVGGIEQTEKGLKFVPGPELFSPSASPDVSMSIGQLNKMRRAGAAATSGDRVYILGGLNPNELSSLEEGQWYLRPVLPDPPD